MKKISKNTVLLAGAVGLGVLCFFGADYYLRSYLTSAETRLAGSYKKREVIVASVEIPAGGTLSYENVAAREIPERYLASTVLGKDEMDAVEGQKIMLALKPGDPIDRGALVRTDSAALSTTVAKGERAITFPVDEISSISGMLVPGDIIDLMYTGAAQKSAAAEAAGAENTQVRLILQSVTVMATGKTTQKRMVRSENGDEQEVNMDFSTVTLKVSPAQAQQVLLAQKLGQLTAVLRNPEDKTVLEKMVLDEATFRSDGRLAAGGRKGKRGTGASYIDMIIGGDGLPVRFRTGIGAAMPVTPRVLAEASEAPVAAPAPVAVPAPMAAAAPAPAKPAAGGNDVRSRLGIATPARKL